MSAVRIGRKSASAQTASKSSSSGGGPSASDHDEVNLVPKLVRDTIAVRHIGKAFRWLVILVIAGAAALWLMQLTPIDQARTRLSEAQGQSTQLTASVQKLAPIGQMYTLLTQQEGFITDALAAQVRVADVLNALQADAGTTIRFTNLALANTGIPQPGVVSDAATACPDANPFTTDVVVGCLSFTGTGGSREEVAAFLLKAASDPAFVNPYVTTTTMGENAAGKPQVTFSGSAGLSLEALATPMSAKDAEALKAALEAAAQQAANPSPSPSAAAAAAASEPAVKP